MNLRWRDEELRAGGNGTLTLSAGGKVVVEQHREKLQNLTLPAGFLLLVPVPINRLLTETRGRHFKVFPLRFCSGSSPDIASIRCLSANKTYGNQQEPNKTKNI